MEEIEDPHEQMFQMRIENCLKALYQNPAGLGVNELSEKSGNHKSNLESILVYLEERDIIEIDRSNARWNIRLKKLAESENDTVEMIEEHFQAFFTSFRESNRVSQVESIVHFIHILSIMQMFVYLNYLNNKTSFEISQATIKNHLDELKKLVEESFSGINQKKRDQYNKRVNQQVGIASSFFMEKAFLANSVLWQRKKHRTIQDLLFDIDLAFPHTMFIKNLANMMEHDIKNKKLDKKRVDSLPIKFEFIETEFFKELDKMQKGLSVFQGDHLLSFADLSKLEEKFLEMSDEQFNQWARDLKKSVVDAPSLTTDSEEAEKMIKRMKEFRETSKTD